MTCVNTSNLYEQPDCICDDYIILYKKRNKTIQITIKNTDLTDITGADVWLSVKKLITDTDEDALITKKSAGLEGGSNDQALITDPTEKIIQFYIVPDDIDEDFEEGDYIMDAVIFLDGKTHQLLEPMRCEVKQPTTLT